MEQRKRGRVASDGYSGLVAGGVSLTPDMWEFLRKQGDGNFNVGVRKVLASAMSGPAPMKSISKPAPRRAAYNPEEPLDEEDVETVADKKRRLFATSCERVMKANDLKWDGRDWFREGAKQNYTGVKRIYSQFPDLRTYAEME